MNSKKCPKCGEVKSTSDFSPCIGRYDGIRAYCKECEKNIRNSDSVKEYMRQYYRKHVVHAVRKIRKKSDQTETKRRYHKWLKENRNDKILAKSKFNYAVSTGKIKREPCIFCGSLKSDAHHQDYSKPLEVIWMCRKHHSLIHTLIRSYRG